MKPSVGSPRRMPRQLSRQELENIVISVQGYLFIDQVGGKEAWSLNKSVEGPEFVQDMSELLEMFGLAPRVLSDPKDWRPGFR